MLRILGTKRTLCDGLSRRDLLQIGGLGALGLGLADGLQAAPQASSSAHSFGKAKSCILVFPYGSPSSHETFDPKPDAPVEIQGEMKAISTSVPGTQIFDSVARISTA